LLYLLYEVASSRDGVAHEARRDRGRRITKGTGDGAMDRFNVAMKRVAAAVVVVGVGTFGAGCGGASGQGGDAPSAGGSSAAASSAEGSMAGVYSATYTGSYTATSASGTASGTSTATATITVTDLGGGEIQTAWQVAPNPPSGVIDFAMSGEDGTATGVPTGGSCFKGLLDNGNTQTNCCTSGSIAFSGSTFTQPNSGTMSGVTAEGESYTGTYAGAWVAERM
jgi:hypothetical protein